MAVAVPVELHGERGFLLYSTQDLSLGGAFFDKAIPLPVGAQVTITVRLPGDAPVVCQGEVVNVPDQKSFGMGVRFLDMQPSDEARLSSFLRSSSKGAP